MCCAAYRNDVSTALRQERGLPGMWPQRKGAGRGSRGPCPVLGLSGSTIAPGQGICHHHAGMTPTRLTAPIFPGCSLALPGGPASQDRPRGLDLSVFALAADMATAVGHSRFGRAKGAFCGTAGAALASGAHRMTVAADIAANITFVDRSRKTAGGTHRHGLPLRVGVTLSGSECPILPRDRSRSRVLWKDRAFFSLSCLSCYDIIKNSLRPSLFPSTSFAAPAHCPSQSAWPTPFAGDARNMANASQSACRADTSMDAQRTRWSCHVRLLSCCMPGHALAGRATGCLWKTVQKCFPDNKKALHHD